MQKSGPRIELTLDQGLQEVVGYIHTGLDLYAACIFLADEAAGGDLYLASAAGDEKLLQYLRQHRVKFGEGLIGACAKDAKPILANDVNKEPRFIRGPLTLTRAAYSVPIVCGGKVAGVLDVQDSRKNRFKKPLMDELNTLAASVARILMSDLRKSGANGGSTKARERLSEERYHQLVNNIQDPIVIMDFNARVLWNNKSAVEFLGVTADELVGSHVSKFLKKGNLHKIVQLFSEMAEGRVVKDFRIELESRNGLKLVEATCTPIPDGGRITSCEVLMRDITEKSTLERLKKNYLKTLEEEVEHRTEEIKDIQRASILAIATLAESIDNFTFGHLERMRQYARIVADELRTWSKYADHITQEYVDLVYDLSPLHDIGKVGIRDSILLKEDKLTADEFAKMKEHAEIGANALRMAGQLVHRESLFAMAEMIARFHHQWWDGSGYPVVKIGDETRALRAEEIPLCARIVALADVYDALTSKRPYKEPYPHEVAKQMIVKDAGRHFDPDCVLAFQNREAEILAIKTKWAETMPETGASANEDVTAFKLSNRDVEFTKRPK